MGDLDWPNDAFDCLLLYLTLSVKLLGNEALHQLLLSFSICFIVFYNNIRALTFIFGVNFFFDRLKLILFMGIG